ncbi:PadR family transcriptional regulator [Hyphobacterium sp. HN65]|uniref:PadR family transcriptional regulator n=1 Tax=Hyphobacterium lacteum TaxID=3116575 RepID=A0ABU7LS95_9PROT|nr:PadR family transcriptional regulator [Hyphobacterium sp. HN65]MEE2526774.1 PadR family transcriptional regulator [Hyphobacterium sp. HN65]
MKQDVKTETSAQWRRGVLEMCVLRLLSEAPDYGYEIVVRLSRLGTLAAGENTVYPILRRLKKDGVVTTFQQASPAGPPRQYYKLTDAGTARLATLKAEWRELAQAVEACLEDGDSHD